MNRNKKKTKGIPKKLLALMLCCFCLVTAMPISAATPEPEATPAVETVVEQPTPSAESTPTAEPSPSAESTPTAEPTPSAEATATAEPSAEPTTEPETASPSPSASASPSTEPAQSEANALNEAQAKATNREATIEQGGSVEVSIDWMRTRDFRVISSDHRGITAETYGDNWLGGADGYRISVSDDVPRGDYELKVHYQTLGLSGNISHDETITVHVTEAGVELTEVYYLKTPTSIPGSNDVGQWGRDIGDGQVKIPDNAPWQGAWVDNDWDPDKNLFNPNQYVVGMPEGMVKQDDGSWLLPKNETYMQDYEAIFKTYKAELQEDLGITLESVDDIEAIYLVPYKISQDNETNPDKHIDCTIRVKCKNFFTATFHVTTPDGTEETVESTNYRIDDLIRETEAVPSDKYPQIREYNDITYELVYWYNEAGQQVTEDQWDYKPNKTELADGSVDFYAYYVPVESTLTVTKNLSGNMYNANDEFTFTVSCGDETEEIKLGDDDFKEFSIPNGATVTITEKDSEGYEFSVASTEPTDLDGYKVEGTSVSFTMPANDVSIVIDNKKDVDIDTGVFLDTLPYILILGVAAAGAVVLVKRRKHSDD